MSFQFGITSLLSGSIKIIFTTESMIKADRVIRLGATHNGTNLSRYSAKGDHKYS